MMRLRFMLIVAIVMGICFASVSAEEGATIRGQITDTTPNQFPIEGALVTITPVDTGVDGEFTTETDAAGEYAYSDLPAGRYLVSVSKAGYQRQLGRQVTVVNGGDHFVPLKMSRQPGGIRFRDMLAAPEVKAVALKERFLSLLPRVVARVSAEYGLDETDVEAFRAEILVPVGAVLEREARLPTDVHGSDQSNSALLEQVLSQPDCRAVFLKYLSKAEYARYIEFLAARQDRERQAVADRLVVTLDADLSLTGTQRDQIRERLYANGAIELPTAMSIIGMDARRAARLIHYQLGVSIEDILTETQAKVWAGLLDAGNPRIIRKGAEVVIIDPIQEIFGDEEVWRDLFTPEALARGIHLKRVEPPEDAGGDEEEESGELEVIEEDPPIDLRDMIRPEDVGAPFEFMIRRDNIRGTDEAAAEKRRTLAAAKLAAHTESLGELDAAATRRLTLATQGVLQMFLEAEDERAEEMREHFEAGMEAEGIDIAAGAALAAAILHDEPPEDIIAHRLYQQAIKDVLSETAFSEYTASQAERAALRRAAVSGLAIACLDAQLLLDAQQRQELETAFSRFTAAPNKEPTEALFFRIFRYSPEHAEHFERLTPWQQIAFEQVFDPLIARGDAGR